MKTLLLVGGLVIVVLALLLRFVDPLRGRPSLIDNAKLGLLLVLGAISMLASHAWFYAEPGHSYLVQFPWGTQTAVLSPGIHPLWWGDVLAFKKVVTVRFTEDKEGESDTATQHDNSVLVRFNDSVRGNISCATRFRLPEDPRRFAQLALDFRSQENLVQSSLVPVTREVIRNAARELSAQSYVTGQGGQFETSILDQMQNGIVMLDVIDVTAASENSSDVEPAVDRIDQSDTDRGVRNTRRTYQKVVRVHLADGTLARKAHPIAQYGILVTQATVENVAFEEMFQEMLAKQRDASARAAVSRQEAKQAEYERQKVMAQGETEKAKIKMEQEKEQVQRIIAAETQEKEQEVLLKTARIDRDRAKVEAEATLTRADAETKARKLQMLADGALEQKLAAWQEVNKAYANAFGLQPLVPSVVVGESQGHTASAADFMNLMMASSAKQLGLDMSMASHKQ
ncbi:MAG TPA: SPFH domain-containing protein [Polyangiales bacterium]|nr:SPFH domain-containing protein [Polyangiales bacterium]